MPTPDYIKKSLQYVNRFGLNMLYDMIENICYGGQALLGYVRAYKPDMKMMDYELYRGIYCSLCRALGRNYSPLAQLFLSYDFALACVIRLACAESGCSFSAKRCPYNPVKKCMICGSRDIFDFCSHAVIITVYYKILDNLHDKGFFSRLGAALIYPAVALMHRKAKILAPETEKAVADAMKLQTETEAKPSPSIDEAAHPSADALGRIFALGAPESKAEALRTIGYLTGRFVYILDADKEGFLRSETSLIQTIGRAARNAEGHVIMYADGMTDSMKNAIRETERRRAIQQRYNEEHGITPTTIKKAVRDLISISKAVDNDGKMDEKDIESMSEKEINTLIKELTKKMNRAAAELDFENAVVLRDRIIELKKMLYETQHG